MIFFLLSLGWRSKGKVSMTRGSGSRTLFAKDEAEARQLHAGLDKTDPSRWMQFKSQAEFESFGDGGFDRQMRRVPLGTSIFVFLDFTIDSDMSPWIEPAVFDATLRLHAFGAKLYLVWLDMDENRCRLDAEWASAQEKAKSLPPKDPDQPPF